MIVRFLLGMGVRSIIHLSHLKIVKVSPWLFDPNGSPIDTFLIQIQLDDMQALEWVPVGELSAIKGLIVGKFCENLDNFNLSEK